MMSCLAWHSHQSTKLIGEFVASIASAAKQDGSAVNNVISHDHGVLVRNFDADLSAINRCRPQ